MTTMKKNRVFLATVVFLLALMTTKVATGDCLVGDIMYSEGDSVGTIGWECHKDNNKTYDGTESVCQNGQVVRKPVVLECSGTVAYCVQCVWTETDWRGAVFVHHHGRARALCQ